MAVLRPWPRHGWPSWRGSSAGIVSLMEQYGAERASMNCCGSVWRVRWREEGLHVHGIEAVGAMAELAGHRHGPLFFQHIPDFFRPQRPQQTGYPALTAATFELHRSSAEHAQVVPGEASTQELFELGNEELTRVQTPHALLCRRPRAGEFFGQVVASFRKLLDEEARDMFVVGREQHAGRQLLRGGEVGLERFRQRAAGERHDALVAH